MNITIKYFGLIAEITGCHDETLEISDLTLYELLENFVYKKYPNLKYEIFNVAYNKEIITGNILITETEIALLPPFSGG